MALLHIFQGLWDRASPTGYLPHIVSDPLPGTPTKELAIHMTGAPSFDEAFELRGSPERLQAMLSDEAYAALRGSPWFLYLAPDGSLALWATGGEGVDATAVAEHAFQLARVLTSGG